jgi:hypothetical protein
MRQLLRRLGAACNICCRRIYDYSMLLIDSMLIRTETKDPHSILAANNQDLNFYCEVNMIQAYAIPVTS